MTPDYCDWEQIRTTDSLTCQWGARTLGTTLLSAPAQPTEAGERLMTPQWDCLSYIMPEGRAPTLVL